MINKLLSIKVLIVVLALVMIVFLLPGTAGLIGRYDKVAHFAVYGFLALFFLPQVWPENRKWFGWIGLGLFGGMVELLQNFKLDGEVSWADFWANIAGIGFVVMLYYVWKIYENRRSLNQ